MTKASIKILGLFLIYTSIREKRVKRGYLLELFCIKNEYNELLLKINIDITWGFYVLWLYARSILFIDPQSESSASSKGK